LNAVKVLFETKTLLITQNFDFEQGISQSIKIRLYCSWSDVFLQEYEI